MSTIERAIIIAAEVHRGQVDKAGLPYIFHPLRLMLRMKTNNERIVAVLHDVVDDFHLLVSDLKERVALEGVINYC